MQTYIPITFYILLIFAGVAHSDIQIQVAEDSVLHILETKTNQPLKSSEAIRVKLQSPATVISPNRIPVLLVPLTSPDEIIKIESPPAADVVEKITEEEMGRRLSKALTEIADIQNAIRNRQLESALQQLNTLQTRDPNIKFYDFLKGSILFLQGNKTEARRLTEEALKIYPDYKEGRKFLSTLKGGK
jgi:tetratricopeptide (TPR) repeat protein